MLYVLISYVDNEYPHIVDQFTNWDEAVTKMTEEIRKRCEECKIDMYNPEFGVDDNWIYTIESWKGRGYVYDGNLNYTWSILKIRI